MKKYKLKVKYPSLHPSWSVGMEVGQGKGDLGYFSPCDASMEDKKIPCSEVFDNPDFWEEVVEKDYEILSFKHFGSHIIWKKDSQLKDTFCIVDGKLPFTYLKEINKYPKVYHIHSIKRLFDGEVFTVGDLISRNDSPVKLETIELDDTWMGGIVINKTTKPNGGECLGTLRKAKKPLFKTEDGVYVFKGDEVYWVLKHGSECKLLDYKGACALHNNILGSETSMYKVFSTEEKAEEYILMNNPCLSINDVLTGYDVSGTKLKTLINTVKSKL